MSDILQFVAGTQFEKSSGLPGSQRVELAIGVPPNRFEPMVGELRNIGELSSIRIDNRILEIEEQIQSTGVSLGDYDQENEFCTVKLSLEEKGAATPGISFRHRAVVALAWTIKYYTLLLAVLIFGTLLTLLVVVILQRLNVIPPPLSQLASVEE
jgi:hypothetical protein